MQYDLLTAALLGVALGVGTTLLLRRGPGGGRPISPVTRGIAWAARGAGRVGNASARWANRQGKQAWRAVSGDELDAHVRRYLGRVRSALDEFVDTEVEDLRRSLRRQRKRFGL